MKEKLESLSGELEGELYYDTTMRTLYATDASAYREMPLAVAIPKTVDDIKKLIAFAQKAKNILDSKNSRHFTGRTGGGQWDYGGCIKIFYTNN